MPAEERGPRGEENRTTRSVHTRTSPTVCATKYTAPAEYEGVCRGCGTRMVVTVGKVGYDGRLRDLFDCGGGCGPRAIAEAFDAPHGAAIVSDPMRWLAPYVEPTNAGRQARPAALPSVATMVGAHEALWTHDDALMYLHYRGLPDATIRRYRLGYMERAGVPAIAMPVLRRNGTKVVGVKLRALPGHAFPGTKKQPTKLALPGSTARLYPGVPPRGPLVLGEGELDALLARERGVRGALTTTVGATLPLSLAAWFAGRRVAVVYDVGKDTAAAKTAEKIIAAGGDAWPVALPMNDDGADLSDFFLAGGTADELYEVIREARG